MEEVLEGDKRKVCVLLVNLGQDGGGDTSNILLGDLVDNSLGFNFLSELGASWE